MDKKRRETIDLEPFFNDPNEEPTVVDWEAPIHQKARSVLNSVPVVNEFVETLKGWLRKTG